MYTHEYIYICVCVCNIIGVEKVRKLEVIRFQDITTFQCKLLPIVKNFISKIKQSGRKYFL